MVQKYKTGIIGGGPAGCTVAYFLRDIDNIVIFDKNPMKTILPTGGGRCNLAHAIYDFKDLASNYPRGEKFLYSVFSKFSTDDTVTLFKDLGIDTYIQKDNRIFPVSNSSKDVKEAFLNNLKNINILKETVLLIELQNDAFKVVTDMNSYFFEKLVITIGGHSDIRIIRRLGINTIEFKPSLVGLLTSENFSELAGTTIHNVLYNDLEGTLLFTHKGISGPLIYKLSSINAREKFPYQITLDLYPEQINLQELFNANPHKQIDNMLSDLLPKKFVLYLLKNINIDNKLKCCEINAKLRDKILEKIHHYTVEIVGTNIDGETVMAGGVNLKEINPVTLESKKIKNLYFAGEVMDIDGFCGGFNLQNCWSTAYVVASSILNQL